MKKILLVLLLCSLGLFIHAQESNTELLKKLVEKNVLTQNEADSIQLMETRQKLAKESFSPFTQKVRHAFNTPYMRFGGYGLFMHRYSDVAPIKNRTDVRVVFLSVRGEITSHLSYFMLMEFANPTLTEYNVTWAPSDAFGLKAGQMKVPLSLENQLSLTDIEGVFNTRSISALIGMADDVMALQNGKNNSGRDIGIQAFGNLFRTSTHHLLHYGIGVYQGTGLNTGENNNNKDFSANLMLQPVKGFRIGGGAHFGEAVYSLDRENIPEASHVRNRWIASSDYRNERIYARAEWINANDGGIKKEGLHGMGLYYFIPQKLNAFAKVDYLNRNKDLNQEVIDYTLGMNYYFFGPCRLQLNYTYSDYSKMWDAPDSNNITAQLQIVF